MFPRNVERGAGVRLADDAYLGWVDIEQFESGVLLREVCATGACC
jgi:hypothetical protein